MFVRVAFLSAATVSQGMFSPYACVRMHALKGLACRARLARLPRTASSRRLRSTCVAAPVLLAHAEVTKNIIFFEWVQNLGTRR